MMPVVAFAAASLARAECEKLSGTADLAATLNGAEAAYVSMDLNGFTATRDQAKALLACLGEPLTPVDVAAFHRMMALDAYLAEDRERVVAAFRALLAVQPGYTLPSTIALPGNALHDIYLAASLMGPGGAVLAAGPAGTVLYVDALMGGDRPLERPAVLQLAAPDGRLLWTGYLARGEEVPDWASMRFDITGAREVMRELDPGRRGPHVALMATSGGVAVIAGGLYAVAYGMSKRFDDPDNPDIDEPDDLYALSRRTNGMVYTSAGLGVVSVALAARAFIDGPGIGARVRW